MNCALNFTRPIVGLAADQFIPLTDTNFVFACLFLPIQGATLLFWAVLLVAIVRDRHYEDPNNLLIMSFALADIVFTSTTLHTCLLFVLDHGYSRGYIGMLCWRFRFHDSDQILLFRVCMGVILYSLQAFALQDCLSL